MLFPFNNKIETACDIKSNDINSMNVAFKHFKFRMESTEYSRLNQINGQFKLNDTGWQQLVRTAIKDVA